MKKIVLLTFILCLLSTALPLCVVGLLSLQIAYASPYTDISVDTAYNMITNGSYPNLVVLDVRTKSEYDSGHIYGAVWIPVTELENRTSELAGHENHEIIVYCWAGGRSATASGILDSHNFTKVYNMLGGISAWQTAGYPVWIATVHNLNTTFNYDTIQAAIDAPQTLDGHTILVDARTYYEHVVVNKSVSLIGENRSTTIIDGSGNGTVINVIANNTMISEFTIRKSGKPAEEYTPSTDTGILVFADYSQVVENTTIINNNIRDNCVGVFIQNSNGSTIVDNKLENNDYGIGIYEAIYNNIDRNTVSNNDGGIWLYSGGNSVSNNTISSNLAYGVQLDGGSSNTVDRNYIGNNGYGIELLSADDNNITGNIMTSNEYGISLASSSGNSIYHNNFICNTIHVQNMASNNTWDDSYPSGGNYWDDYDKVDADGDGIGDAPYMIDANNQDRYPLVVPLGPIPIVWDGMIYPIEINSNSTISRFHFNASQKMISFNVTGLDGTLGFCNLTIPNSLVQDLWQGNFTVLVDGEEPIMTNNWTDGTYTYVYFTYQHPTHKVEIIPEFPAWTSMLFILIVLTATIAIYKRRLLKTPIH